MTNCEQFLAMSRKEQFVFLPTIKPCLQPSGNIIPGIQWFIQGTTDQFVFPIQHGIAQIPLLNTHIIPTIHWIGPVEKWPLPQQRLCLAEEFTDGLQEAYIAMLTAPIKTDGLNPPSFKWLTRVITFETNKGRVIQPQEYTTFKPCNIDIGKGVLHIDPSDAPTLPLADPMVLFDSFDMKVPLYN